MYETNLNPVEVDGFLRFGSSRAVSRSGIGVRQLRDQDSLFVVGGKRP